MRYLTLSELIFINGSLLENENILAGTLEIRDQGLLEAAAARPASSAFGEDAYPTLREKAAALFHSLVRNHPFTDGNKRTAAVALIFMFAVNGQRVIWDQEEALRIIIEAAENRLGLAELAAWFPLETGSASLEPDAPKDMECIAQIRLDQRWLLDELRKR